ncbi:C-reactive protein-like [Centroberyx affinis]|uniref:C-reactive protein-like n=1 Tax=Centroberyx affinis TaxID=166261 RepID=UPI003A5C51ED
MKFLLLVVMLTACAAAPQDLSGKMFTFPQQTNLTHVKLETSRREFSAVTVCLRSFTDFSRNHALFSLAMPSAANDFLIFKNTAADQVGPYVKDKNVDVGGQDYKLNTWHSVSAPWWPMGRIRPGQRKKGPARCLLLHTGKLASNTIVNKMSLSTFKKDPGSDYRSFSLIYPRFAPPDNWRRNLDLGLGRKPTFGTEYLEQDSHGGRFDIKQCFIGMISDVHMWDYVLSPCEIQRYVDDLNFTPGNVLNWRALQFQITGRVLLENKQVNECH